MLSGLLTVTTAGYLVGHLLVCLAAPLFLRRIGELTAVPVVVPALTVPVLVLVLVCAAFVVSAVGGAVPVVLGGRLWSPAWRCAGPPSGSPNRTRTW